jgi:hypothetical protein
MLKISFQKKLKNANVACITLDGEFDQDDSLESFLINQGWLSNNELEPFDEISENQINKFDLFIFILRSKKYNTPKNFINSNNELYKKLRKLPSMTIGVGENSKGSLSIRNVPEKNQKILSIISFLKKPFEIMYNISFT